MAHTNIQTKDYTYKAHKCMGTKGYKIALEDMTTQDVKAIEAKLNSIKQVKVTYHASKQIEERGLAVTAKDFEAILANVNYIVELQVKDDGKLGLLLRAPHPTEDYDLCFCSTLDGIIITAYGNEKWQKHNNKNPKFYHKGGNVAELLK